MPIPTPHIEAKKGDFAKTVLMPGDPLRAKFIAETYLENAKLVNNVRGIQGYTGTYKGTPVSVMASGMGMPSMGIYSYELFNFYDVDNIIRIGSCGSLNKDVKIRDIVIGMSASTNSSYVKQFGVPDTFAPTCDYTLLETAVKYCKNLDARYNVGNLFSSDTFYNADPSLNESLIKLGVMGIEMEAAALYLNAAYAGKRALAICTVSDNIVTGEETTSAERQTSFTQMMEIALETAKEMDLK